MEEPVFINEKCSCSAVSSVLLCSVENIRTSIKTLYEDYMVTSLSVVIDDRTGASVTLNMNLHCVVRSIICSNFSTLEHSVIAVFSVLVSIT